MRGMMVNLMAMALLAGCDSADRTARDAAAAANQIGDAADRLANDSGRLGNMTAKLDNAADRATNAADRALPAASAIVTDDWVGRWRGVEGMNLEIARDQAKGAGHYRLTMQYDLDHKGVFDGVAKGDVIRFSRPDGDWDLSESDGADTGLKYLADRDDCLVVKPGEGYCRG